MLMLQLLRYLRGYVKFIITGSFPQRIINSCKIQKIPLWDIVPKDKSISAKAYAKDYKRIKHLRKSRNTKFAISEKHGIPFSLSKLKKRYGILLGAAASLILLSFLTSRIWIINVNTENPALKTEILSCLESLGIKKGVKSSSIDVKNAQRKLMILENKLAWDSLNIKGCKLMVETSEKENPPPKEFSKEKHSDIIAECDGHIVYMEIRNGQSLCQKGDTVGKGDILVSGTMVDQYGGIRCVYSTGKVYALCSQSITAAVPKKEKLPVPTEKSFSQYRFILGDRNFLLSPKGKGETIQLSQKRIDLPFFDNISIVKEIMQPVKYNTITYNRAQMQKKAEDIFEKRTKELDCIKLISSKTTEKEDGNFLYVTYDIDYIKDIAVIREF